MKNLMNVHKVQDLYCIHITRLLQNNIKCFRQQEDSILKFNGSAYQIPTNNYRVYKIANLTTLAYIHSTNLLFRNEINFQ